VCSLLRSPVVAILVLLLGVFTGCREGGGDAASRKRVIVLGFDGMDYVLVQRLLSEGRMPNFARLSSEGTFGPLGTAIPPQSPVAWSSFITGMDAGGHGIFDFVHRNPKTMVPYLSTSRAEESEKSLKIGRWQFPLVAGKVELLRRGEPFWDVLERHGVETTIIRIPANFPPSGSASRELSGMGTPDILGTYGTFSFFTSAPSTFAGEEVSGGKVYGVDLLDGVVRGKLYGPNNPFLVKKEKVAADFTLYVDPEEPVAVLALGDEERVLQVGEWSDWVTVAFELIPTQTLHALARFYLKSVDPDFEMYVSPLNIDPESPALPISTPGGYAAELARATGDFYTQGMPEDTKALTEGVLTREEFLAQARIAGEENLAQYKYVLGQFDEGVLFYYFGNLDQISHMMWRPMDPGHPTYDPAVDARFEDVIPDIYETLDEVVSALGEIGPKVVTDNTSVWSGDHCMDHETVPGILLTNRPPKRPASELKDLAARILAEFGIVPPETRAGLMEEIAERLLRAVDPGTGKRAVTKVYRREEAFRDRGELEIDEPAAEAARVGAEGSGCRDSGRVRDRGISLPGSDPRLRHAIIHPWRFVNMFGSTRVKLDKELVGKVKRYAEIAGYSSPEEFITHALEKELAKLEGADSEEEIKKRLRGLGYIS
jgi:predicted AlkP superfamily phosphohydrolase/phosphomutase